MRNKSLVMIAFFVTLYLIAISNAKATQQIYLKIDDGVATDTNGYIGPFSGGILYKEAMKFPVNGSGINISRIDINFMRESGASLDDVYVYIENITTGDPVNTYAGTPIANCQATIPGFVVAAYTYKNASFTPSGCQLQGGDRMYAIVMNTTNSNTLTDNRYKTLQNTSSIFSNGNFVHWDSTSGGTWVNYFYGLNFRMWFDGPDIEIIYPENTTYYNNLTIQLNVSNRTFNSDKWFFSLNDGVNTSFTPNSTMLISQGQNKLIVWANDSSNNWYFSTRFFTMTVACNSQTVGSSSCSGDAMNYVVLCKQFSFSNYQWDYDNMTFCKDGCFAGQCLQKINTCMDRCKINESYCTNPKEAVNCINYPLIGCNDWNTSSTYCQFGCSNGICIQNHNTCTPHESKCLESVSGDFVTFCLDDNNDTFYDWSQNNKTYCTMGCKESVNPTTGVYNATCNYHSFDDMYTLQNSMAMIFQPLVYGFKYNPIAMYVFWFVLTMIVTMAVAFFTRNSRITVATMLMFLFAGGLIGWMPIYVPILIVILIGGMIFLKGGNGNEKSN